MLGSVVGLVALAVSLAVGAYAIRDSQAKARQQRLEAEEKRVNEKVATAVTEALERARVNGIEAGFAELRKRLDRSGNGDARDSQ